MTTVEYTQHIIYEKQESIATKNINEEAIYETAQLLSGSFIYPLYGALWVEFYDLNSISKHLEDLYSSGNHYGLLYFIVLLANTMEFDIPQIFAQMSAYDNYVQCLSSAIIEDWMECHATSEATEMT